MESRIISDYYRCCTKGFLEEIMKIDERYEIIPDEKYLIESIFRYRNNVTKYLLNKSEYQKYSEIAFEMAMYVQSSEIVEFLINDDNLSSHIDFNRFYFGMRGFCKKYPELSENIHSRKKKSIIMSY